MYSMPKLHNSMGSTQVMLVITEGHVGAADIISDLVDASATFEPGHSNIMPFIKGIDELELYGNKMYEFYRDVCDRKIEVFAAIIMLYRYEQVSAQTIYDMIEQKNKWAANACYRRMCEISPRYANISSVSIKS